MTSEQLPRSLWSFLLERIRGSSALFVGTALIALPLLLAAGCASSNAVHSPTVTELDLDQPSKPTREVGARPSLTDPGLGQARDEELALREPSLSNPAAETRNADGTPTSVDLDRPSARPGSDARDVNVTVRPRNGASNSMAPNSIDQRASAVRPNQNDERYTPNVVVRNSGTRERLTPPDLNGNRLDGAMGDTVDAAAEERRADLQRAVASDRDDRQNLTSLRQAALDVIDRHIGLRRELTSAESLRLQNALERLLAVEMLDDSHQVEDYERIIRSAEKVPNLGVTRKLMLAAFYDRLGDEDARDELLETLTIGRTASSSRLTVDRLEIESVRRGGQLVPGSSNNVRAGDAVEFSFEVNGVGYKNTARGFVPDLDVELALLGDDGNAIETRSLGRSLNSVTNANSPYPIKVTVPVPSRLSGRRVDFEFRITDRVSGLHARDSVRTRVLR